MLYLIRKIGTNQFKIGISKNPQRRLKQLQTGSGDRLLLHRTWQLKDDRSTEKKLHRMFWQSKSRHNGEWFELSNAHLDFLIDHVEQNC